MGPRNAWGKLGSGRVTEGQLGPPRVGEIITNNAMCGNKKGETIANFQERVWGQFWGLDAPRVRSVG